MRVLSKYNTLKRDKNQAKLSVSVQSYPYCVLGHILASYATQI